MTRRSLRDLVNDFPQYRKLLQRIIESLPDSRLFVYGTYGYGYSKYVDVDVLVCPGDMLSPSEAACKVTDNCSQSYTVLSANISDAYSDYDLVPIKMMPVGANGACKHINLVFANKDIANAAQQASIMMSRMPQINDKQVRIGVFIALQNLFKSERNIVLSV